MQTRLIALAVFLLALLGAGLYIGHLRHEVQTLNQKVLSQQQDLDRQNAAIDEMKREADRRLAEAQKQIDEAKAEAEKAKGKATIIYKSKPANPNDLCASALQLMNGGKK